MVRATPACTELQWRTGIRRRTGDVQCFLVGAGGDQAGQGLSDLAKDLGLSCAASASLAELRNDRRFLEAARPLVLIPETPSAPLDVAAAIDFAREQSGRSFVVCLADAIAPGDYKQLVRTGSAEWITVRDCREELRDIVGRMSVGASPHRAATVLSFVPSKGGVGNTTVLIEVAIHLSTRRKRSGVRASPSWISISRAARWPMRSTSSLASTWLKSSTGRSGSTSSWWTSSRAGTRRASMSSRARSAGSAPDAVKPDTVFTFIDSIASRYDAILFDLPAAMVVLD